jgi:antitoxin component of MazEF toxin-antitoxin module
LLPQKEAAVMVKYLRKVGNSNALLLDKPILELLGLEEEGEVQLTVANGSLIVTPVQPRRVDAKRFEASLGRVVARRRRVLRRLAQ